MPKLDLDDQDHLACDVGASGDGEYKCDTAAASDDAGAVDVSATAARADDDGDAPAESVLIRVRSGIGLSELLCAALRRDGSTKGSSNPKAAAEAAAAARPKHGAPRAVSTRSAAASKTPAVAIGVLPAAACKVVANKERRARAPGRVVVSHSWRRPAAGARVFASEAVGPEPVSPKVSCLGAVLPETRAAAAPPAAGKRQEEEEEWGGCWASVAAALRGLCCSCDNEPREGEPGASESSGSKAAAPEIRIAAAVLSPPRPVVGLGDVKRLASRRWPETMAADERSSV
ncbi:unnamed protein product [Urochloa humidicola]